jgi:hypothetical protein
MKTEKFIRAIFHNTEIPVQNPPLHEIWMWHKDGILYLKDHDGVVTELNVNNKDAWDGAVEALITISGLTGLIVSDGAGNFSAIGNNAGDWNKAFALNLGVITPVNDVKAGFVATIVSRPDDFVKQVASTGTITVTGTPVAEETLTVFDQVFTFKAARAIAGEITINANNDTQATNIKDAILADITEAIPSITAGTLNVVNLVSINTAPYHGVGGDVIALTEVATGIAVSGAGTLTGGVNEVRSYLTINGVNYTFGSTVGDDSLEVYPNDVPVVTAAAAAMGDIATALATALKLDVNTFIQADVTVVNENITAKYKEYGTSGNFIAYVNHLQVAGDITTTGIVGGLFTGGSVVTPVAEVGAYGYKSDFTERYDRVSTHLWKKTTLSSL